jgi:hypothetical protein
MRIPMKADMPLGRFNPGPSLHVPVGVPPPKVGGKSYPIAPMTTQHRPFNITTYEPKPKYILDNLRTHTTPQLPSDRTKPKLSCV